METLLSQKYQSPQPAAGASDQLPMEGIIERTINLSLGTGLLLSASWLQKNWTLSASAAAGVCLSVFLLWTLKLFIPMVLRPVTQEAPPAKKMLASGFGHVLGVTGMLAAMWLAPGKAGKLALILGFAYPHVILGLKVLGRALFGEGRVKKAVAASAVALMAFSAGMKSIQAAPVQAPVMAEAEGQGETEESSEAADTEATSEEASGEEEAASEEEKTEEASEPQVREGEAAATEHEAPEAGKAEEGHAEGGHEAGEHHGGVPHVPTLFAWVGIDKLDAFKSIQAFLGTPEKPLDAGTVEQFFWFFFTIGLLAFVAMSITGKMQKIPKGAQAFFEIMIGFVTDMVEGVMGPQGARYVPFVGTIFLFILSMNYLGFVPGYNGPTACINTTAALAITVFLYAQYEGIRNNGVGGYLMHFVGEPKWLFPLMFPLHVVGEFIKPISLALRLFGNIYGEHVLAAGFITLVAGAGTLFKVGAVEVPFPLPVHFIMMLLGLLASFIQAMVFSLLATIYIFLLLPHDDHEHGEAHTAVEKGHH